MKIYILPVVKTLQPSSMKVTYPPHNDDYSVEQDFLLYLQQNPELVTSNAAQADFHYLPVFWTRWLMNNRYTNQFNKLLPEYIHNVQQAIIDDSKTFSTAQMPRTSLLVEVGKIIFFSTSRTSNNVIDLPLICKPHRLPTQMPDCKYRVSFVGKLSTHPIREAMVECFKDFPDSYISNEELKTDLYVQKILESLVVLSPRGKSASSFRFYETMQLGRVPLLIGNYDTRPFQKYLQWEQCSFYTTSPREAVDLVENCSPKELETMGQRSAEMWQKSLTFGKWCQYVMKELSDL
jgi:hypothetical protein